MELTKITNEMKLQMIENSIVNLEKQMYANYLQQVANGSEASSEQIKNFEAGVVRLKEEYEKVKAEIASV